MTILDRLERHLAPFAIPNLIRYVVILNALSFVLTQMNPAYAQALILDPNAVLQGQVWRLISWIFLSGFGIWAPLYAFYLMFLWWMGDILEASWGTFRLNAYYFLGMFLCTSSALIFGAPMGADFLNLSLLLALATVAPNLEILFFFVIPMKLKWLALISLYLPVSRFLSGPTSEKMLIVVCLANYVLFFGPMFVRRSIENRNIHARRTRFEAAKIPESDTLHRCEVCGATENSAPDAEFRVAADGNEYCVKHLPSRAEGTA